MSPKADSSSAASTDTPAIAPPAIGAVIVAAGASRRMGEPKALLRVDGRPLIQAHIQALGRVCARVIVVTGAHAAAVRPWLQSAEEVHVQDWADSEMVHSVRAGAAALPGFRLLIQPVDTPPATPRLLAQLVAGPSSCVPFGPNGPGHPICLGPQDTRRLWDAPTLRDALEDAPRLRVAEPVHVDFDHPQAWRAWLDSRPSAACLRGGSNKKRPPRDGGR